MANTSVHAVIHKEAAQQPYPAAKSSAAAKIVARLRHDLAAPQALEADTLN